MTSNEEVITILVVDDEENIAALVRMVLEAAKYHVIEVHSGEAAIEAADQHPIDLVVLDIMLGGVDGFAVAEKIRGRGHNMPVLFLSARDEVNDKVRGLALGDDYLTKPFAVDELVARVSALLRRSGKVERHSLVVGNLELNEDNFSVTRDGVVISLTPTEFKLLRLLMSNVGKVVSRDQIIAAVWDIDVDGRANVDTYISYLRKKIDGDFAHQMVTTVRGFGYTLTPEQ